MNILFRSYCRISGQVFQREKRMIPKNNRMKLFCHITSKRQLKKRNNIYNNNNPSQKISHKIHTYTTPTLSTFEMEMNCEKSTPILIFSVRFQLRFDSILIRSAPNSITQKKEEKNTHSSRAAALSIHMYVKL